MYSPQNFTPPPPLKSFIKPYNFLQNKKKKKQKLTPSKSSTRRLVLLILLLIIGAGIFFSPNWLKKQQPRSRSKTSLSSPESTRFVDVISDDPAFPLNTEQFKPLPDSGNSATFTEIKNVNQQLLNERIQLYIRGFNNKITDLFESETQSVKEISTANGETAQFLLTGLDQLKREIFEVPNALKMTTFDWRTGDNRARLSQYLQDRIKQFQIRVLEVGDKVKSTCLQLNLELVRIHKQNEEVSFRKKIFFWGLLCLSIVIGVGYFGYKKFAVPEFSRITTPQSLLQPAEISIIEKKFEVPDSSRIIVYNSEDRKTYSLFSEFETSGKVDYFYFDITKCINESSFGFKTNKFFICYNGYCVYKTKQTNDDETIIEKKISESSSNTKDIFFMLLLDKPIRNNEKESFDAEFVLLKNLIISSSCEDPRYIIQRLEIRISNPQTFVEDDLFSFEDSAELLQYLNKQTVVKMKMLLLYQDKKIWCVRNGSDFIDPSDVSDKIMMQGIEKDRLVVLNFTKCIISTSTYNITEKGLKDWFHEHFIVVKNDPLYFHLTGNRSKDSELKTLTEFYSDDRSIFGLYVGVNLRIRYGKHKKYLNNNQLLPWNEKDIEEWKKFDEVSLLGAYIQRKKLWRKNKKKKNKFYSI